MFRFRGSVFSFKLSKLTSKKITDNTTDPQSRTGLVTVFTGDGKGKTTAAIGTIVRAAGYGIKVGVIFFLKGKMFSQGEVSVLKNLPTVTVFNFGIEQWLKKGQFDLSATQQARQALAKASEIIKSGDYELVVLDEINGAVDFGLISVSDVLSVLANRPKALDLILTGRNADAGIIEIADVVTEMNSIKHAFERGITARLGIDY